ncbi:MAG TPA: hydrolase 2, exosortase A system-associated [Rhodocyclaceae bacterium]|nr:hydrolase 2, exosortase A system-associated [Rhodocyclaceae bacterium]
MPAVRLQPSFLDAPSGRLFCLTVLPSFAPRGVIVHAPAFAEEMNKARRMTALAARRFAEQGWIVISPDLYGTGDSAGDFGDANWISWVGDLAWLERRCAEQYAGLPIHWWGTRTGALLTAAVLRERVELGTTSNVLWWQPIASGKQFLTQFLRLKLAGGLANESPNSESSSGESAAMDTRRLREALARGEPIEIAGYLLSPAMAEGLERASLDMSSGYVSTVTWLEISSRDPADLSPASQQRVAALKNNGIGISARALNGLPFWQSVEIAEVPALIDASLNALAAFEQS